jgi:cysteinyl-tRNA synthetase
MKDVMLTITNTLTGKKEPFVPLQPGHVRMYVCGITPYDRAHLGHGRCYVSFDLLHRLLVLLGYQVRYVRNFTDIDDKLLNRSQEQFSDRHEYRKVANHFIGTYHADMDALNCVRPQVEPRVTDHIPEIITFIAGLIDAGYAYVVEGDVYFEVRKFESYGKLSKRNLDDLCVGARVEVNEKKRDPLDFALWKSEPDGEFWSSPWGYGRPGWHIECSALANRYLGSQIDIHAGGLDLVFPHHENEIAQSEALHQEAFARYWVHNGFVTINKEKMSKSVGNFFTLDEVLTQIDPMVLRFYYLTHHYRAPLEFSFDTVITLKKTYQRLVDAFGKVADTHASYAQLEQDPMAKAMIDFLCDDLNSQGMIGFIFEHMQHLKTDSVRATLVASILRHVLGLTLEPLAQDVVAITPEIQALIDARENARIVKDWKRADELRSQLEKLGITVQDKKL